MNKTRDGLAIDLRNLQDEIRGISPKLSIYKDLKKREQDLIDQLGGQSIPAPQRKKKPRDISEQIDNFLEKIEKKKRSEIKAKRKNVKKKVKARVKKIPKPFPPPKPKIPVPVYPECIVQDCHKPMAEFLPKRLKGLPRTIKPDSVMAGKCHAHALLAKKTLRKEIALATGMSSDYAKI